MWIFNFFYCNCWRCYMVIHKWFITWAVAFWWNDLFWRIYSFLISTMWIIKSVAALQAYYSIPSEKWYYELFTVHAPHLIVSVVRCRLLALLSQCKWRGKSAGTGVATKLCQSTSSVLHSVWIFALQLLFYLLHMLLTLLEMCCSCCVSFLLCFWSVMRTTFWKNFFVFRKKSF